VVIIGSVLSVCTVPSGPITVPENNTADLQLVTIVSVSDAALSISVNPEDLFYLKGNALMVKKGLDYEVSLCSLSMTSNGSVRDYATRGVAPWWSGERMQL